MNKTTKTLLFAGLGAFALYIIFKPTGANAAPIDLIDNPTPPTPNPTGCPEGEIPCTNQPVGGRPKCYNPNIDYFVNPCN